MKNRSVILCLFLLILLNPAFGQDKYFLKVVDVYASCQDFEIQDSLGNMPDLPSRVRESLVCPFMLDITDGLLCYEHSNKVFLYNLISGSDDELFSWPEDADGIAGPCWSPTRDKVAFVIINQQQTQAYESFARLVICKLDTNGHLEQMQYFDRPVNFECGSVCTSAAGEDFRFEGENKIGYMRNINIEEKPGEW